VLLPHVQKVMGHDSIATTMQYVHTNSEDIARSVARLSFDGMVTEGAGETKQSSHVPDNQDRDRSKPAA